MAEKVYQLTSEQIGVIQFNKSWLFVHVGVNNNEFQFNHMYDEINKGVKNFPTLFEENVINVWLSEGKAGEERIDRLRQYLLNTWWNPGIETMRKALYEQYGAPEFKEKSGKELVYDGYGFLALTVAHIALRLNKKHFWFEGLHVSCRVVDKFLAVNFWDKLKTDALAKIGTTILK